MNWEQFDKYVGVQGILAIILTLAVVAWNSFDIHTSNEIYGLLGLAWGFYFSKNGSRIITQVRDRYIERRVK